MHYMHLKKSGGEKIDSNSLSGFDNFDSIESIVVSEEPYRHDIAHRHGLNKNVITLWSIIEKNTDKIPT